MQHDSNGKRYPLASGVPWQTIVFGGLALIAIVQDPAVLLIKGGEVHLVQFWGLLLTIPFAALLWWWGSISVEVTDQSLIIHGALTRRIPFTQIRAIARPRRGESVSWDEFIAPFSRSLGTVESANGDGDLLLVQVRGSWIAFQFTDPNPVFSDLDGRLNAFRKAAK